MSVRFEYDDERKLLLVTFAGVLQDEELVRAYRTGQELQKTHEIALGVVDGTAVTSFSISTDLVKSLASRPPMFPELSDRYICVAQTVLYGMARMYQLLAGQSRERLRVVRTVEDAYNDLKIQPPQHLKPIDSL